MIRLTFTKIGSQSIIGGTKLLLLVISIVICVTPTPLKFRSEAFTTPFGFTVPYKTFGSKTRIHDKNEILTLHSTTVQDSIETQKKSIRNHRKKKKPNQRRNHDRKKVKTYKDIKAEKRKNMKSPLTIETNQEAHEKFQSVSFSHPSQMDSNRIPNNTTIRFKNGTTANTLHASTSNIPNNQKSSSSVYSETSSANHSPNNNIQARIHNIHDIKVTRTMEEKKRSHDRMEKAQRLLRDLSPINNQTMEVELDISSNQKELSSQTVPDTFWYNGNLEEGKGDYVTRWAKGVKVAEPLVKYDPIAAEKLLFRQPGKWIVRNIQIGFPLALWAGSVIVDIVRNEEEQNRRNRAKQLLKVISGLGPAIIKGGQALSSRSDLLPSEYLEELQKLQDDVPRFENDVAFQRVEEELGDSFDNIFELVESEPVAAASKYCDSFSFMYIYHSIS